MIVIVDYGMGNLASIKNMVKKVGGKAIVSSDPLEISSASALILPGVGSFDNAILKLANSGLKQVILNFVDSGKPLLGICLGMQLLFESSEEGTMNGLGLIEGSVAKFNFDDGNLKVPHMGWNKVNVKNSNACNLFNDLELDNRFYFVHSYYVICNNSENICATANYGFEFTCSVKKDNVYGAQFHPEKSHKFGMKFFENFLEIL